VAKKARSTKSKPKTKSRKAVVSSSQSTRKKKQSGSASGTRAKGRVKKAVKEKPEKAAKKKAATAVKPKASKKKAGHKRVAKPKPPQVSKRALPKVKRKSQAKVAPRARKKAVKEKARLLAPSEAVKAFGQAVNLFYHQDFDHARRAFASFINRFPEETEMIARARSYVAICEQRLSHPPSLPRDAEALYNRGIIELNYGRILEAISYFEKALKYEPEASHIIYSLAAAHARLGSAEKALAELKDAIRLREILRIQARHDSDFISLYTHPEFQELVGWELVEEPAPLPQPSES